MRASVHPCNCSSKRHRAFSLFEIITVAIVLAAIATMAVPRYSDFLVNQRLEAAARRLVVDMALAQREARFTGTDKTVTFNTATDRYTLVGIPDLDHPQKDYEAILIGEPYRTNILTADFGGEDKVVFNGFGIPSSGGSVTIKVGRMVKTITFDGEAGDPEVLPAQEVSEF